MKRFGFLFLVIALALCSEPGFGDEALVINFDNPAAPFFDSSPEQHAVIIKSLFTAGQVLWSDAAPRSPAGGGYGVFDDTAYLLALAPPEFVFPAHGDFTIRFWFRSSGIRRGLAYAEKYRTRMHPLSLGVLSDAKQENLEFDFDEFDGGWGLLTYWNGGGASPAIGTHDDLTDDRWRHVWLVRETVGATSTLSLYVGDDQLNYTLIGSRVENTKMGSLGAPVRIGCLWDPPNSLGTAPTGLCWVGSLDDVRISREAIHPCANFCCLRPCCVGNSCLETTVDRCAQMGGQFHPNEARCGLGNCLVGSLCFPTSQTLCSQREGTWLGVGVCPAAPPHP
ncbi:MAG: LamG-like jellyroll fold domain-containing protein [Thermoanaerobaculia bacterium]|nr:LamG-like jellyroll fold domain-containing protein [Thermoanaerobaculia bacterium]